MPSVSNHNGFWIYDDNLTREQERLLSNPKSFKGKSKAEINRIIEEIARSSGNANPRQRPDDEDEVFVARPKKKPTFKQAFNVELPNWDISTEASKKQKKRKTTGVKTVRMKRKKVEWNDKKLSLWKSNLADRGITVKKGKSNGWYYERKSRKSGKVYPVYFRNK